jgi:hypothetical protein
MSFAYATRCGAPIGALLLALLASCNGEGDGRPRGGLTSGSVPAGALRFTTTTVLELRPGTQTTLTLVGPSTSEPVRVWLDGDYRDASLDRAVAGLESGRADFTLLAPSAPTRFLVRAHVDDATTRLDVAVNAAGYAQVRVLPKYHGQRAAPSVVTSLFVSRNCQDLVNSFATWPPGATTDGLPRAEGPLGAALVLPSVPAATEVSVFARIERYAAGCTRVAPLLVGATGEVELEIYDRSLDLAPTFAVDLKVEPNDTELQAWRDTVVPFSSDWIDAFFGPNPTTEADWLLDSMTTAAAAYTSGGGVAFESARTTGGYDAKATTWLTARPPTIHARVTDSVHLGIDQPPTPLSLDVNPGPAIGEGKVTPRYLEGYSLANGWITAPAPFDWSADASDVLRLSGVMSLKPGALFALAANAGAVTKGAPDFTTSIATGVDCTGLAQALVGAGNSIPQCNATCTAALCRSAISLRENAATATMDARYPPLTLGITSSASPDVGPDANVRSFAGSWTGTVQGVASPFGLRGTLTGKRNL